MPFAHRLHPIIDSSRAKLARGRAKYRDLHLSGSPGIQVSTGLTEFMEQFVLELYQHALSETDDPGLESCQALVAHGGLGRGDLAPFSDVDLMLLIVDRQEDRIVPLARRFSQYLFDVGLQVGLSVRTVRDACQMAWQDATVFTTLTESRYLAGDSRLFQRFWDGFRRGTTRRSQMLIDKVVLARREERAHYGETEYLLRPNLKRSRGCLREIQLVRWVGFAAYGDSDPLRLEQLGYLLPEDRKKLLVAREFLLQLRNELHFHANKPQDVLDRSEQLRVAELYGFQGDEGQLPVEKFMRRYFEHTSEVRYTASHFVKSARAPSKLKVFAGKVFSRRAEHGFVIGPNAIWATRQGLRNLRGNLSLVLQLMVLANYCNKQIDHRTWVAIREDMIQNEFLALSGDAIERFLALLSQPTRLGDLLRRLHQLRVLEKLIPPLTHARCLVQFNDYHKYTVDEHCIRSVERATEFLKAQEPLGDAYRGIREKRTLHLALLLHDLGKGFADDHSQRGARLAAETARHLDLPLREAELIETLVSKHLRMSDVAFRHDLNNESVILSFAREVGSLEALQLLYVLTCADVAAVGPDALTSWKRDLLAELYLRTREHLSGDVHVPRAPMRLDALRRDLLAQVDDPQHMEWWRAQIRSLPAGYITPASQSRVLAELARLRDLSPGEAVAWSHVLPDHQAIEYTVGAHEELVPGIFHRLTGVLTSLGHDILSAEIHTLAGKLVLDRFYVYDLDFAGAPSAERQQQVADALVRSLQDPTDRPPAFRRLWKVGAAGGTEPVLQSMPIRVRFDNSTSEQHTIVTVFAYDRMGLLYAITRVLFELGLSVHVAKIATHLDQVVDVFYITDQKGEKILEEARLAVVEQRLLSAAASQAA
jgi:[protein-PII] uridylyltransferase